MLTLRQQSPTPTGYPIAGAARCAGRSFDFETSRVELAKYAYEHVADRQNFYRVYEAFDFESSVQKVQQAVAR